MSYDIDRALVSRLIEDRNIRPLLKAHVLPTHLEDKQSRSVLKYLLKEYDKRGKVPSSRLVEEHFPDFEMEDSEGDDVEAVLETISKRHLHGAIKKELLAIANEATDDPHAGLEALKAAAMKLSVDRPGATSVNASQGGKKLTKLYDFYRRSRGKTIGLPLPWRSANKVTRGIRPGSYSVIYGPTGSLKTWLLLWIADFLHRIGYRPVFFTYEMASEDVETRRNVMRAGLDYGKFQDGLLSKKERRKLDRVTSVMDEEEPFIIEELESSGPAALTEIRAKLAQHNADIGLIDGLSFLIADHEHTSFGDANKGLRVLALKTRIPIFATHHANRNRTNKIDESDDMKDVALGDTLSRYAENVFRLYRTQQHEDNDEIDVTVKKCREGRRKPRRFLINAKPAFDFSEKDYPLGEEGGDDGDDGISA